MLAWPRAVIAQGAANCPLVAVLVPGTAVNYLTRGLRMGCASSVTLKTRTSSLSITARREWPLVGDLDFRFRSTCDVAGPSGRSGTTSRQLFVRSTTYPVLRTESRTASLPEFVARRTSCLWHRSEPYTWPDCVVLDQARGGQKVRVRSCGHPFVERVRSSSRVALDTSGEVLACGTWIEHSGLGKRTECDAPCAKY